MNIHITMKNALLIFIKNPIKGQAKTRLAATVGDEEALRIYKELLRHTRQIAQKTTTQRYLFYSHFIDNNDEWSNDSFNKKLQIDGDLGQKMAAGFQEAFNNQLEKVIIIGSDCASLTTDIVENAFKALEKTDFVIGPAEDGGYYLLGMRIFSPSLFENIEWSTPQVFTQTINRIKVLDNTYSLLPTLSDIDYEEDWKKYGW